MGNRQYSISLSGDDALFLMEYGGHVSVGRGVRRLITENRNSPSPEGAAAALLEQLERSPDARRLCREASDFIRALLKRAPASNTGFD